jgi:hypothetical protein
MDEERRLRGNGSICLAVYGAVGLPRASCRMTIGWSRPFTPLALLGVDGLLRVRLKKLFGIVRRSPTPSAWPEKAAADEIARPTPLVARCTQSQAVRRIHSATDGTLSWSTRKSR